MFLFVAYALVVWYAALRWRRRTAGIASIVAAMFGLHLFNLVHGDIASSFGYDQNIFRGLMYPYMALVGAIGLYLFSFPRELPRGRVHCRACWFDLSDHEELTLDTPCPECGTTAAEAQSRKGRKTARRRLATSDPVAEIPGLRLAPEPHAATPLSADNANRNPQEQHTER